MGQAQTCVSVSDLSSVNFCVNSDPEQTQMEQAKTAFFDASHKHKHNSNSNISMHDLSAVNRRAVACAHLIADTIKLFFESPENVCIKQSVDIRSILDNIYIIGHSPRNYLLKRDIRSIDIAVNTRDLTKLHLYHLRKHHATRQAQLANSQCVLWKLYMQKFNANVGGKSADAFTSAADPFVLTNGPSNGRDHSNIKEMKKFEFIADCEYIVNARFIVEYILSAHFSSLLANKLSVHRDVNTKTYHCQCIDALLYPKHSGVDLDEQCFSVFDISDKIMMYKQLLGSISTQQRLDAVTHIHAQNRLQLQAAKNANHKKGAFNSDASNSDSPPSVSPSPSPQLTFQQLQSPAVTHETLASVSLSSLHLAAMENMLAESEEFRRPRESLPAFQLRLNDKPFGSTRHVIGIELPFYEVKLREVIKCMPFSINTLTVRMSDVLDLHSTQSENMQQTHEDEKSESEEEDNGKTDGVCVNFDWTDKLRNGLDDYNALQDFKLKRLTHPYPMYAVHDQHFDAYFWKLVRYGIFLHSWNIDPKLVKLTKSQYAQWMSNETHWPQTSRNDGQKTNYETFVDTMFDSSVCFNQSLKQYQRMHALFKMLDTHRPLLKMIRKIEPFQLYFVQMLHALKSDEKTDIVQLFASNGYAVDIDHN